MAFIDAEDLQAELDLIAASGWWSGFPPRLLGQPIFYPVLNEAYATKIASDWNTKDDAEDVLSLR